MPRISVCCAVYNQSDWLMEMIASVRKQTFADWELIVVDDGSSENIREVVEAFNDPRLIYERMPENRGIPHGVNLAFSMATGEFVQPLAADERLAPTKFAEQVEYFDAHPEIEAIWGLPGNGEVGARPEWEQYRLQAHNRSNEAWVRTLLNLENVPIGGASALWRRSLFDRIGYFDPKLTVFSDHEWFTRFFAGGGRGRILPFRWATSRPAGPGSVRATQASKIAAELAYVREKHPMPVPAVEPSVTVAIAVYNMAHWIGETLKSLYAQTVPVTEILIVDDCSTDDLAGALAAVADPRIRLFKMEENSGNMAAQNYMLTQAQGMFYVPLGADDTVEPDYVERCLKEFRENPYLEFCASQTDFMDSEGVKITPERAQEEGNQFWKEATAIPKPINSERQMLLAQLYAGNLYFGVGMYRTDALRDLGGWKREYGVLADYEMYLALLQRENVRVVEAPLTHTRLHDRNISNLAANKAHETKTLPELYKAAKSKYYAPRMKVIIATPFYEMRGFSPYISSLAYTTKLLSAVGIEWEFWELAGDSYVHRARNTICARFLEDLDATDLFFIDSDMSWNPDAFVRMLMLPEEIVGGSYPTKNNWDAWTSYPQLKEEDGKLYPVGRPLQDGSALIVADQLAAGFLRIKRSALERFQAFYKEEHVYREPCADASNPDRLYTEFFACMVRDKTMFGEDRTFCIRMKEAGVDLHLFPNVSFGHYGIKGWMGNYDKFLRKGDTPATEQTTPQQIRAH